jgi:hypothetical protein
LQENKGKCCYKNIFKRPLWIIIWNKTRMKYNAWVLFLVDHRDLSFLLFCFHEDFPRLSFSTSHLLMWLENLGKQIDHAQSGPPQMDFFFFFFVFWPPILGKQALPSPSIKILGSWCSVEKSLIPALSETRWANQSYLGIKKIM